MEFKINPEYENLNPPLSREEAEDLKTSIKHSGIRTELHVLSDGTILCGHNRYNIAKELKIPEDQIPYKIIDIPDELDCKIYIIEDNLYRRQLSAPWRIELTSVVDKLERDKAKQRKKSTQLKGKNSDGVPIIGGGNISTTEEKGKSRDKLGEKAKVSGKTYERAIKVKEEKPDLWKKCLDDEKTINSAYKEIQRERILKDLQNKSEKEITQPTGEYDIIVIDPPWNMEKIERDCRPNQVEFDYPTMSIEELEQLTIPSAENCHLFLWTTHKFLPSAFHLLTSWKFKYVCTFVWHKPGGFQPIGLPQYNCEFVLYARKGTPIFSDTKSFFTCFSAERGKHSEKPEEFYDTLRRVTVGRRLDMFNRRKIDGFIGWGKESDGI